MHKIIYLCKVLEQSSLAEVMRIHIMPQSIKLRSGKKRFLTCRKSSFPLIFSAACLVGGCIIFAGALHAHTAIFDG